MAIGVQESDVWAAADVLLHAGEQPTIERVRMQMGRGSPNTVGPHLKAWFRALGERLQASGQASGPVPDTVNQAAQQFWELALSAAKDEWQQAVALERQSLAQEQEALAADQQALRAEQKRLDQRETDLKAAIYSAREQAAASLDRAQTLEAQLKQSDSRASALESRLAEFAERERVLQERQHEAESRHRLEMATAEQRHASHERRWLNDIDVQRQAAKKTQDDLDQQRQVTKKVQGELAQQRQDSAAQQLTLRTALDETANALRIANDKLGAVTDECHGARHELDQANQELINTKQALIDAQRIATESEHARQSMQTQIEVTRSTAATVEHGLKERLADLGQRVAEQGTQLQIKDQQIAAQAQALAQWGAPSLAAHRKPQGE